MTRIGIRELRDTLTQVIRRVRNGESIEITHDGEPVATIVPYPREILVYDHRLAEAAAAAGLEVLSPGA